MNFDEFLKTLEEKNPPSNIKDELTAIWHDAKGDWDKAHKIVQDMNSQDAAWVHALLHREEGDLSNASYWYGRAGKPVCNDPLDEERKNIARTFLSK